MAINRCVAVSVCEEGQPSSDMPHPVPELQIIVCKCLLPLAMKVIRVAICGHACQQILYSLIHLALLHISVRDNVRRPSSLLATKLLTVYQKLM